MEIKRIGLDLAKYVFQVHAVDNNAERPHSTHGILTPNEVHASKTAPMRMAA
ncbi:MAG: hypothetical protein ACNA7M_01255 [Roseovarius sp.]